MRWHLCNWTDLLRELFKWAEQENLTFAKFHLLRGEQAGLNRIHQQTGHVSASCKLGDVFKVVLLVVVTVQEAVPAVIPYFRLFIYFFANFTSGVLGNWGVHSRSEMLLHYKNFFLWDSPVWTGSWWRNLHGDSTDWRMMSFFITNARMLVFHFWAFVSTFVFVRWKIKDRTEQRSQWFGKVYLRMNSDSSGWFERKSDICWWSSQRASAN